MFLNQLEFNDENVYSLGAYQINQQDFILDILYENPELGAPVNFLTEGPDISNQLLIQVFNVDNLNNNNDQDPDGVFDFLDGIQLMLQMVGNIFQCWSHLVVFERKSLVMEL